MKRNVLRCIVGAMILMLSNNIALGDELSIGMVNSLTGPAAGLGSGMKAGSSVYFDKINAAGGINGNKLKLISIDDGYEPERTAPATEKLINEDRVFALFGFVGTPTSKAAVPAASKAGVPFIAPFTGAEFLRNPVNKQVFNIRASYFDETEGLVDHFVKDLGLKKIAIFIQDDAYGEAGKGGVNRALHQRDLTLVAEGRYKRNTEDVDAGLAILKAADPEVVIMVGTYKACAAFVKKSKAAGFKPRFANVSFVGTADFIKEAGKDSDGVFISQVMPSPKDTSLAIVARYHADMKAAGNNDINYTSLEGYIDAVVFTEALKKVTGAMTREALISAFESVNTDLGGFKISFSPTNHQGSKQVFFTKVQNGEAIPVTKF